MNSLLIAALIVGVFYVIRREFSRLIALIIGPDGWWIIFFVAIGAYCLVYLNNVRRY